MKKIKQECYILQSLDVENAVYEMDWTSLTVSSRKDLLMLTVRASKPILFRVGPIMNMNIDSFLNVSYIVYDICWMAKCYTEKLLRRVPENSGTYIVYGIGVTNRQNI